MRLRRILREDKLHFCDLCDHEWEPSQQELANVEYNSVTGIDLAATPKPEMQSAWASPQATDIS
jgi:hypothetical protein